MLYGDSELTQRTIGCAIEVHRGLGSGLLESVYESALCLEFEDTGIPFQRQCGIPLFYKGRLLSEHRPDLIVNDQVIIEVKSVERLAPIHLAQMLTYLRVARKPIGLILNFNSPTLKAGLRKVVLNA